MIAPTGSQSNIVVKTKAVEQMDGSVPKGWKGKGSDEEFKFNRRGKLKENEIQELKRTHRSLKNWALKTETLKSGGESVVKKVSLFE